MQILPRQGVLLHAAASARSNTIVAVANSATNFAVIAASSFWCRFYPPVCISSTISISSSISHNLTLLIALANTNTLLDSYNRDIGSKSESVAVFKIFHDTARYSINKPAVMSC